MKILIAEDDPISRLLLETTLVKAGREVVVSARDGDEALAALQREDAPPLAILDWMMPGTDGIEICRKLREADCATPTYIILLTAKSHREDIVAATGSRRLAPAHSTYVTTKLVNELRVLTLLRHDDLRAKISPVKSNQRLESDL